MTYQTHPLALEALEAVKRRLFRLWLPPVPMTIGEWAEKYRTLPVASGRPGPWQADPIQREIQDSCCDTTVREVVFQKAARLGWSEICNNAIGWGLHLHSIAMLMTQPSRETAEKYCKDRLDEMVESTEVLRELLRESTSKKAGSTTRDKRMRNGGSLFVASAGNPRELRSFRARFAIEDEVDGYDVAEDEGDPDQIIRRRGDEFHDFRMLIGSTPAKPSGVSRIERAYSRSSQGLYLVPCPHCNAMEPFRWRHPDQPDLYLLKFERNADRQVLPDSLHWTCIRCGSAIEEKWKVPMMEEGRWHHQRPGITAVKGYFANGFYVMAPGHWLKMAQEWGDAQGDTELLKAFINLNLAETFQEPGESIEPSFLRTRADAEDRPRGLVPDGIAVLLVQVDVQTSGLGRLEAQVIGFMPDERAFLIDWQAFHGDPNQESVWEDLDTWLLAGWRHQNGANLQAHLVLVDARDGNVRDSVYKYCGPRAPRWIFPQMGVDRLTSKGWAEESSARKNITRMFLTGTDDVKRALFARINQDPGAPKSIHLPKWVTDEYLEQLGAEKRVSSKDPKTGKVTWTWIKTRPRNEALDLWVYALSGWWILTRILVPSLSGPDGRAQLEAIAATASATQTGNVTYQAAQGRQIRSMGIFGRQR